LGIEATCDQSEESNESALLSLFDVNDTFGNFLSNPYESSSQEEKNSELKPFGTGDEFLPSQLLSDLLSGSTEPITKVSRRFYIDRIDSSSCLCNNALFVNSFCTFYRCCVYILLNPILIITFII